jgi:hypothetical protein
MVAASILMAGQVTLARRANDASQKSRLCFDKLSMSAYEVWN